MKISKVVASSEHRAIANDALKDEDNGFWLNDLPKSVQSVWLQRFYWIRWVDRLAEQDQLVRPGGKRFPAFYQAWQRLRTQGYLSQADQSWRVLCEIEACWFVTGDSCQQAEIVAWNDYVEAIATYHQPSLTLNTLQDYENMLEQLAGACFRVMPYLQEHQREKAGKFGVVDQFYNNLRDLYEDARQGVCYFPTELLQHFSLTREEILDLSCLQQPGYTALMDFWINFYLPQLRERNLGITIATDLHPTWKLLTRWFMHRYVRVEQVLERCQYDFVAFAERYWPAVQYDLSHQRGVSNQNPAVLS